MCDTIVHVFEVLQHTADIRLHVTGHSSEELFADALRGLMRVVEPEGMTSEAVTAEVRLDATDTTVLLVDFLNEALTRAHVRREVYDSVSFATLTDTEVAATLRGVRVGGFREDVKAVTYHEAEVEVRDGVWSTTLVFDI